jgi:hypothetical protein
LLRTTKLENRIYVLEKNLIPGRVLVSSLFKKKVGTKMILTHGLKERVPTVL